MADNGNTIARLRKQVAAGTISSQDMLSEIEVLLHTEGEEPIPGALELLLEALHGDSKNPVILRLLGRLYERDGHPQAARRAREMAERAENRAEAAEMVDDEIAADASLHSQLSLGRVLTEVGLIDRAGEVVEKAIEADPTNMSALNLLSKIRHIQGRLSEAIRTWWKIQELSSNQEAALAHLGILHRLSEDDEMVGKRFATVGEGYYAPKHEAQIEIERAFTKFRDKDFKAAIATADALANSNVAQAQSAPIFKLATLQKAWFQERTGDLEGARVTLETLGRHRGFETDLDRIGYLARICERLDTPASREMALSIYEHLDKHHRKLSALPRLAALWKAQGDEELSAKYAEEYERQFIRRMKKPTTADFVVALSTEYIPLTSIPKCSLCDPDLALAELEIRTAPNDNLRLLRRGLLSFLQDAPEEARTMLAELVERTDAPALADAYLADLLALKSETTHAERLYAHALEAAPPGGLRDLWMRLMDTAPEPLSSESLPPLGRNTLNRVRQELYEAAQQQPGSFEWWQQLAFVEKLRGDHAAGARFDKKAQALIAADNHCHPGVGMVLMAARYGFGGKPKGMIHEMICGRRPRRGGGGVLPLEDIQGNLVPDLKEYLRLVFAATRGYALLMWPHLCSSIDQYSYTLRITKDDEPSSGSSAGLPAAIAFLSVFFQKPVPPDMAFTGQINSDSRRELVINRVGDIPVKIQGAFHRNLNAIVLPEDSRPDVDNADLIPAAIANSIVRYARNLGDAIEIVWGADAWNW